MKAKCSGCQKTFTRLSKDVFQERQIEDNLYEIGIECPSCKKWYHNYYLNENLKMRQEKLMKMGEALIKMPKTKVKGQEVLTSEGRKMADEYARYQAEYRRDYTIFQMEQREERGAEMPQATSQEKIERARRLQAKEDHEQKKLIP
jgi:hypothetical protein